MRGTFGGALTESDFVVLLLNNTDKALLDATFNGCPQSGAVCLELFRAEVMMTLPESVFTGNWKKGKRCISHSTT